jgi:hypothetical protein
MNLMEFEINTIKYKYYRTSAIHAISRAYFPLSRTVGQAVQSSEPIEVGTILHLLPSKPNILVLD